MSSKQAREQRGLRPQKMLTAVPLNVHTGLAILTLLYGPVCIVLWPSSVRASAQAGQVFADSERDSNGLYH